MLSDSGMMFGNIFSHTCESILSGLPPIIARRMKPVPASAWERYVLYEPMLTLYR